MIIFIDEHCDRVGVQSLCQLLPISPSTYYAHKSAERDPSKRSARACRDAQLIKHIQRVWLENFSVYGARKVWRQLQREGIAVARCTVERLMRHLGLQGVVRGAHKRTTVAAKTPGPADRVDRQFLATRPNELWVADFTYVSTWQGFAYVAFVIDVFARRIVGWKVQRTMHNELTLDALEQAIAQRLGCDAEGLIHHSDRGVQYLSIRYSERLLEAGIDASVGSVGDSYDNALAESIIGLFKTEVIHRQGPWRDERVLELATLHWVDWFNTRRIQEFNGYRTPSEIEQLYDQSGSALAA